MSTARFLLALACSCTSAAAALAAPASAAELELGLARGTALYLRLDASAGVLEIKVRGIVLDRVETRAVRLVEAAGRGEPGMPELPAVWRVAAGPAVAWRRVVAPPTLVPYDDDAPPPTLAAASPTPVVLPAQQRVELERGWTLDVGPSPPGGRWQRFGHRLATGWRRVTGREVEPAAPAIVVVTSAEDSRRLLHVLRAGTALLVTCGENTSAGSSTGRAAAASGGASG